ncbi:MAG: endonuclease/exonuclease/phosphatase family protein [Clostridiales bacterium]|nr:endonuclease/exonuclease/phosphatase family protein [Clostridiales bacterium]
MKKILKIVGIIIAVLVVLTGICLLTLTLTDYNPEAIIDLEVNSNTKEILDSKDTFTIHTWNIGYGGLGVTEDFFLDGGSKIRADEKSVVESFLDNIIETLIEFDTDFAMIQEIDVKSQRAYHINELDLISDVFDTYDYSFAKNYDVLFVPIPFPPVGDVEAGLATFSQYNISDAKRYSFDSNYNWPLNTIMLDRCFVVSEIEIPEQEGNLLLINAHFSAYDDGTLREEQLKVIKDYIIGMYDKGYYVVLGGDWNQTFESVDKQYPLYKNGELFLPSVIPNDWVEEGWTLGISDNAPTYRLLNAPYVEGETQVGVIDGFLVSPNIIVEMVEVIDLGFENSDHNPVKMIFRFK